MLDIYKVMIYILSAVILRMSSIVLKPIVVKPIDEFTFEDAQKLETPLYIGDNANEYMSRFKPRKYSLFTTGDDEKTGVSKSMTIQNTNDKKEYEVFVRRYDEPPKEKKDFGKFLDNNLRGGEYDKNFIWVILGAKNMKEAINSFENFMKTGDIRESENWTAINVMDPIQKEENDAKKAELKREEEDVQKALMKEARDDAEERARLSEERRKNGRDEFPATGKDSDFWGGRGRTTRKKYRKSIKRTKRSKSVKRHSRSKSRKSRSRK